MEIKHFILLFSSTGLCLLPVILHTRRGYKMSVPMASIVARYGMVSQECMEGI